MVSKPQRRTKFVGVATSDWSGTVHSPSGAPSLGGAGWVRFGQIVRRSRNRVIVGGLVAGPEGLGIHGWDGQMYFGCDVLFLQRHMDAWVTRAVGDAVSAGQVVVNDVDDWFWGLHPANAASGAVDPVLNPDSNTDHYLATLRASTAVTVSTPWLAARMREWGLPVSLVPNRVTVDDFRPRLHGDGQPVLGWTGSTAHRSGDLAVLAEFVAELPVSWRWHHTGDLPPAHPSFADEVGIHRRRVTTLPLMPPWQYPDGFCFDIGVVPLSEHPFNHAKSWIKGLEYAAAGIPFVASASPEYLRLRDEFGIGRVAATKDQWLRHLHELADPLVRAQEAVRQWQLVREHLDVGRQARDLDDLVDRLLG